MLTDKTTNALGWGRVKTETVCTDPWLDPELLAYNHRHSQDTTGQDGYDSPS